MAVQPVERNTSLTPPAGPNVEHVRKALSDKLPYYTLIDDCIAGSMVIKRKREVYLPIPDAANQSQENIARYEAYLKRAVFFNVTKRTLGGLTGQIFLRDPVVEIPDEMNLLKDDFTGSGVTLKQTAFLMCWTVISKGRIGIYTDFPVTDGALTAKQITEGSVRASNTIYFAEDIINWRSTVIKGKELLTLIVLSESYVVADDGFQETLGKQYRVLSIDADKRFKVEIWRATTGSFAAVETETQYPKDAKGNWLTEIPFYFVGVVDNTSNVDEPPLYDLAELNIHHYMNSADFEEACFMCGQPTPVFTGLTQDWVTNVMKGEVNLGSRGSVSLPVGATADLLQADPNNLPATGMEMKERQMVALGAKLVQQQAVQRTATEAGLESNSEVSTLANIADNVSAALKNCMIACARFMGQDETSISVKLNKEFDLTQLTSQEMQQVIDAYVQKAITWSEMRAIFRRGGYATKDDEKAKEELKQDVKDGVAPVPTVTGVPKPSGSQPAPPQQ